MIPFHKAMKLFDSPTAYAIMIVVLLSESRNPCWILSNTSAASNRSRAKNHCPNLIHLLAASGFPMMPLGCLRNRTPASMRKSNPLSSNFVPLDLIAAMILLRFFREKISVIAPMISRFVIAHKNSRICPSLLLT